MYTLMYLAGVVFGRWLYIGDAANDQAAYADSVFAGHQPPKYIFLFRELRDAARFLLVPRRADADITSYDPARILKIGGAE